MNIIDIILLAILALSFISGMQKGFLASLLATFGFVGAWIAAMALNMTLSQQFMSSQFKTWLDVNIRFEGLLSELGDVGQRACSAAAGSLESILAALSKGGVPESVVNAFNANFSSFGSLTVNEYLAQTIWQAAFNVISFVIVFAICYAVLMLLVNLLNNMFRIPKLRGVDALLGGVLGAVRGYAVICLAVAIIPMIFTALDSSVIETLFDGSSLGAFFLNGKSVFSDLFGVGGQLEKIIAELPKLPITAL